MEPPSLYQPTVNRACNTDPKGEEERNAACDDIIASIKEGKLALVDLAVLLAAPLTSPEREAREYGTRLLGKVVARCRRVLGAGELHTLSEFLAARLRDWPCVGAAADACHALLAADSASSSETAAGGPAEGFGGAAIGGGVELRDESVMLVLEATAEVLRSSQSFRQEERSGLLRLLLEAAEGRWGRLAAAPQLGLLEAFLGAVDGEKDPRCLLLAFRAMRALCRLYHRPGADPGALAALAPELVDWLSAYFPLSFNPPPGAHRGPGAAITRPQLAGALESALSCSPFLASGVLPLLLEKLSSTYRPAKEDALSALRCCCPAYGSHALAPFATQLWSALRNEVLAPCGSTTTTTAAAAGGLRAAAMDGGGMGEAVGGPAADARLTLSAAAAACLMVVVRAAGPGVIDALALQDAAVNELVALAGGSESSSRAEWAVSPTRSDIRLLCGSTLLGAICAAGPTALRSAITSTLGPLHAAVMNSLQSSNTAMDMCGQYEQTLYGMTVLMNVLDAVAMEMQPTAADSSAWLCSSDADGTGTALGEVRHMLIEVLNAVHAHLFPSSSPAAIVNTSARHRPINTDDDDVDMEDVAQAVQAVHDASLYDNSEGMMTDGAGSNSRQRERDAVPVATEDALQRGRYSPAAAAQLRLALVAGWRAVLGLHRAALAAAVQISTSGGGAAALDCLLLSADQQLTAVGQLCDCVLRVYDAMPAAAAPKRKVPYRMRWGVEVNVSQEVAGALQMLLQLPQRSTAAAAAASSSMEGTGGCAPSLRPSAAMVQMLIGRLVVAMSTATGRVSSESYEDDDTEGNGGLRGEALDLVVELTQAPAPPPVQQRGRVPDEVEVAAAGTCAFAAALLDSLPSVLLRGVWGGAGDERFLRNCLHQLTTRVLLPLMPAPTTSPPGHNHTSTATAFVAMPKESATTTAEDTTTAAVAAKESAAEAAAAAAHRFVTAVFVAAMEWEASGCIGLPFAGATDQPGEGMGAVVAAAGSEGALSPPPLSSPLVAIWCSTVQQLVAACDGRRQLALALEAAEHIATAAANLAAAAAVHLQAREPQSPPSLPGLRNPRTAVLPFSCAVIAGLHPGLLAPHSCLTLADSLLKVLTQSGVLGAPAEGTATAAVALAAVVNRWLDQSSLNEWLEGPFRYAVLCNAQPAPQEQGMAAMALAEAGAGLVSSSSATVVRVLIAGWVSRALALRSHPGLSQVLTELLRWLDGAPTAVHSEVRQTELQAGEDVVVSLRSAAVAVEAFGLLVAETAGGGGVSLTAASGRAVVRVLWQQRSYSLAVQALAAEVQRCAPGPGPLPLPLAAAVGCLAAAAPRALCRNDAARMAPLLLRSAESLCQSLTTGTPPAVALPTGLVLTGLRGVLAVVTDWLLRQAAEPAEQLGQVLQHHVTELVSCICEAAAVGAPARRARTVTTTSTTGTIVPSTPLPLATGVSAVAVREEALRCCTTLMDALPYHLLHPLRQRVRDCIVAALDDNRRSVRQLAVRARRAWEDK